MSSSSNNRFTTVQYLNRHQIKAALEKVLNELATTKPDKPFDFLSQQFNKLATLPKPQVIFVLGGPGAGKGTQCANIVRDYGFVHLSAGDLLREERNAGNETGQLIDNYIKEGKIVPVEITVELLRKAMSLAQLSGKFRFLIDGFPRNQENLDGWFSNVGDFADVHFVLFFECPESVMEARLLERGKTSGRTDDNIESIKKRFATYVESTMPVINYFDKQGKVRKVDSTVSVNEVYSNVQKVMDADFSRQSSSSSTTSSSSSSATKPQVLFVLGGPGAGKGTQCANIVRDYGFVHLSAGDLLRDERNKGNETGQLIDNYIKEGKIVPVEITVNLLKNAMSASIASGSKPVFLIDGFPRNQENLDGWNRVMGDDAKVLGVLFFECPESVMEARLLERGKTSGRTDDNIESIKKRFATYVESTMPIVNHFASQNKSFKVDGTEPVDQVFRNVQKVLSGLGF